MIAFQNLADQLGLNLDQTSLPSLAAHLVLALALSHVLAWHYVRYAQVLSDRRKLGRVLVFVSVTTLLIISVLKTSLALSLGLVGALSIIRFRTPIKEPEELAYLFMAIAVGVGLGAEHALETVAILVVAMVVMALRGEAGGKPGHLRTILEVHAPDAEPEPSLTSLMPAVAAHCQRLDLRRVDYADDGFHASLLIELASVERLQDLLDEVRRALPGALVSAVERDSLD
jgi:hypothetical protein